MTSGGMGTSSSWRLRVPLRPWQSDAIHEWHRAGQKGVIEAATGTGKTVVAMAAIEWAYQQYGEQARVAVVVPSIALAHQWRRDLRRNLGMSDRDIGEMHSRPEHEWTGSQPVLVSVINTARDWLESVVIRWHQQGLTVLLIVDECHHAGSEYNATVLDCEPEHTMGLSATPTRDDLGHLWVYDSLGEPCYTYPLIEALDDGTLAPLRSINLYVDFTPAEQQEWDELTSEISERFARLLAEHPQLASEGSSGLTAVARLARSGDSTAAALLSSVSKRRLVLSDAQGRAAAAEQTVEWLAHTRLRALMFHETVEMAERTYELLRAMGIPSRLEHSGLDRVTRQRALMAFESGTATVLSVVRTVDEGVDVPDAACAVFVSGSRSKRQRIQRLGRILRSTPDKQAVAISFLVRGTPEEAGVGLRDESLLGQSRVAHHRWPAVKLEDAVGNLSSSYKPTGRMWSKADSLTGPQLGMIEDPLSAGTWPFGATHWHRADDVRRYLGADEQWFSLARKDARAAVRRPLDPLNASNPDLIYGAEAINLERLWRQRWEALARAARRASRPAKDAEIEPTSVTITDVMTAANSLISELVPPTRSKLADRLGITTEQLKTIMNPQASARLVSDVNRVNREKIWRARQEAWRRKNE